ncbi:acetolactate synthase-1/2/3 large subunit [Constrictibacter sp. MBR-5]|uniref:acetolactate synthase large subunit n=1 Tax=Constrictibacter sp. MBR-5 TaxID=3156467 RepID=UPI0033928173
MNGAESLVRTLVENEVDVCFTNPGTSEMHFVAALDKVDGMRCVLGLFEGVVTGAADGYARMLDKPACTLLHLGPGLANASANLHNAKKANSPIVNIVGEHATYHIKYDAPLTADIEGLARPVSHWVRTSPDAKSVARDGAEAITASMSGAGQIATLILPANTAWNEADGTVRMPAVPKLPTVPEDGVKAAAEALRSAGAAGMLLLSGIAVREKGLELAGRIAAKTGCRVMAQGSNARVQRGAGRFSVNRIPYPVDQALAVLKDVSKLVLVGAKHPVAFFAYPDKPSLLTPADCHVLPLATLEQDMLDALERLADALGAKSTEPKLQKLARPDLPSGALNPDSIAAILGALLPENAIVCDESVTTGRGFYPLTAGAPPHDWLQNMGGSIGLGLPLATGCAVACPDRKVVCLEGDGSGMYTVQSLWTMAREKLDVTVLVFANRTYQILKGELANVGAGNPGRKAMDMLEIGRPDLDWVSMARSMGVEAGRASTAEELAHQFQAGLRSEGPYLIEVML